MRIGIDGLFACNNWGGLSTYARQIITHLVQVDTENEYILFVEKESQSPVAASEHVQIQWLDKRPKRQTFYDERLVWDQEILGDAVATAGIDLFFGPVFMTPLTRPCPAVITVHDLIFITHPQVYPVSTLGYYGVWGRLCAESAEGMITMSHDTKRLLGSRYGLDEAKVTVTYGAVEESFRPAENNDAVTALQQKYNFKPNYVIYVGGTFPERKNYPTLIRAYAQLPKTLRQIHPLVFLTGSKQSYGKRRMQEVFEEEQLGSDVTEDIVVLDFVERDELVTFYQGADVMVYPSIYEGFGLPPLEAMSCGTPVITTTAPAMNEVVADGGLLVDPLDVAGMAGALERVLRDADFKQQLGKVGLARSRQFSWQETARGTLAAFEKIVR
ncbi:MAG: glycosyltransferase family 1 protein [Chloroflexota bacterium]